MANIVGNILVKIGADLGDLEKGIIKAGNQLKTFGQDMSKLGMELTIIGDSLTKKITEPLMNFGKVSLDAATNFEQGLSKVKAVSGATAEEMQKLHDLSVEMGAATAFSALEAAGGMEELLKAGLSVDQVLNGALEGSLALAAAGEISLADAAEIASNVLNSFRDDALTVAQAADILAGAANASATDVGLLKTGLAQVSAVASMAGMTFEDTATALAIFAQNGVKGSDAGTALKTMLTRLQPATDAALLQFQRLGLVTEEGANLFYTAGGELKSLAEISELLNAAMADLTSEERQEALRIMFGQDAIRAGAILFKEGAEGVEAMKAAMADVTAVEVAAEKMNNFSGAMEELGGSVETVQILLGERFLPVLTDLAQHAQQLVNKFAALPEPIQNAALVATALVAAIGPLIAIIGGAVGALGGLIAAVGVIVTALEGFLIPVLAVGAGLVVIGTAVATAVATFTQLYSISESLRSGLDTIAGIFKTLGKHIQALVKANLPAFQKIFRTISEEIIPALKKRFSEFVEKVIPKAMEIFEAAAEILDEVVRAAFEFFANDVMPAAQKAVEDLWPTVETIFGQIASLVEEVWPAVADIITTALKAIKEIFLAVWPVVKELTMNTWAALKEIIHGNMLFIQGALNMILGAIRGDFGLIWKGIFQELQGIWKLIAAAANGFASNLATICRGALQIIAQLFDSTWQYLSGSTATIFQNIYNAIYNALNSSINYITSYTSAISGAIDRVKEFIGLAPAGGADIEVPGFARGVQNYSGGLALVGEEGPELVNLPGGSDVYSASQTKSMLAPAPITIENMIVRSDQDIKLIAKELYNLQKTNQRSLGGTPAWL